MTRGRKALWWFLGTTAFVALGVGIYSLTEYIRIKKINSKVTSPNEAIDIINQKLGNG